MKNFSSPEFLESRIAPAAVVTVEFTNGVLKLIGDNGGAEVTLTAADDTHYVLTGGSDTTFTQGAETGLTVILLTGPFKGLDATFGSGSDSFLINGTDFKGNISVDLGDGTNSLSLDSITTTGNLDVKGGTGDDRVLVEGLGAEIKGAVTIDLGDAAVDGNVFGVVANSFGVGKDLTYTGGPGIDSVGASAQIRIKGSATFELGAGDAEVTVVGASFTVGKKLTIKAPTLPEGMDPLLEPAQLASIQILAPIVSIGGDLGITTGAGDDDVLIGTIGGQSSIRGKVSIESGDGDDGIAAFFYGGKPKSVLLDAGDGDNSLAFILAGGSAGDITLRAGDGEDTAFAVLLGGKAGTIDADLGDGGNLFFSVLISSSAKLVNYTGGAEDDVAAAITFHSKLTRGVTAEIGAGSGGFSVFGFGGSIGAVKLTSESTALDTVYASVGGALSTFASVDIDTGLGDAAIALQSSIGGVVPISIPFLTLPSTDGLVQDWKVKGLTKITAAGEENTVILEGTGVNLAGGLTLDMRGEKNEVNIEGVNLNIKKLTYTGGAGNDNVGVGGHVTLGNVLLDLGDGENGAIFVGSARPIKVGALEHISRSAAGNMDILVLAKAQVLGKLNARMGDGDSTVYVLDSAFGNKVDIKTNGGDDKVEIDAEASDGYATTFKKQVNIDLGAGDDKITIGGDPMDRFSFVITKSTFTVDGGTGLNALNYVEADNEFAKPIDARNFVL